MKKLIAHATTSRIIVTKNIYAFMAHMSGNDECSSEHFGDSSQLTNWILDSGETCYMTPEVSYFTSGSLEYTCKKLKLRTDMTPHRNKKHKYK